MHRPLSRAGATSCVSFVAAALLSTLPGCTPTQVALASAGVTATAARAPTHELRQVYYLGVLDPLEQTPPQLFRVTVHGQASAMSLMRFASGWVPASVADSLALAPDLSAQATPGGLAFATPDGQRATLAAGRRLVLFGPEGFREAPQDHRLVIVMGSNPEAYFRAVSDVSGFAASVRADSAGNAASALSLSNAVLRELHATRDLRARFERIACLGDDH